MQRWLRKDFKPSHQLYGKGIFAQKISKERVSALKAFRADAMSGAFPAKEQSVDIDPRELEGFLERLEARGRNS